MCDMFSSAGKVFEWYVIWVVKSSVFNFNYSQYLTRSSLQRHMKLAEEGSVIKLPVYNLTCFNYSYEWPLLVESSAQFKYILSNFTTKNGKSLIV